VAREHEVKIRLSGSEFEELDELRGGIERAVWLRQAIHRPPDTTDVATRAESLAILTSLARDGRVSAAIALERALRGEDGAGDGDLLSNILGDGG
jgi:hypothetical protein